ncbi:hypothetical protein F4778DRAFT_192523 [Xylariomycetidae sp. FL2044]|nr:hypothetical protein F4778DRAFT_192523 [Xylariomycetidae sp. FL2044]
MAEPICNDVARCLRSFEAIAAVPLARTDKSGKTQIASIRKEYAKFWEWCQEVDACKVGVGSFQYRLREASNIDEVRELLGRLHGSLDEVSVNDANIARAILSGEQKDLEDEISSAESQADTPERGGVGDPAGRIARIIESILQLPRNPPPYDRERCISQIDASRFSHHDHRSVCKEFPGRDNDLRARLAREITRRRQYIEYKGQQYVKLVKDHPRTGDGEAARQDMASLRDPSRHRHFLQATGTGLRKIFPHRAPAGREPGPPHVPEDDPKVEMPEAGDDGIFECSLCNTPMLVAETTAESWKSHVYADLCPYICLDEDCPEDGTTRFAYRSQWEAHYRRKHWTWWRCRRCNDYYEFINPDHLEKHLRSDHGWVPGNRMDREIRDCEVRAPADEFIPRWCPLCDTYLLHLHTYISHVGGHQEELARFALWDPRPQTPDPEEER